MKNGMIYSRIRLAMKQNIYGKKIIKQRTLQCLFIPGLIANRWKETPKAHRRLYPPEIRVSRTPLFVKSIVTQICFEGRY